MDHTANVPLTVSHKPHLLIGLIIGICLAVTVGSIYFAYKANKNAVSVWNATVNMQTTVQNHDTALKEIISFLNKAQQPQ